MKLVEIEEKLIYGLSTRTKNSNEMNPQTMKIAPLWQKFDNEIKVDYKGGQRVYGVYYNYESDANGEFDVMAGYEIANNSLDSVKLQKGKYLMFHKTFDGVNDNARIQAIIGTWDKIWQYFSDKNSEYKRAYGTDFEYYKNRDEIEIYISIK